MRKQLKAGDIKYLSGSKTKVEVMADLDGKNPICKILETSKTSKYKVGETVMISRRVLYSENRRFK